MSRYKIILTFSLTFLALGISLTACDFDPGSTTTPGQDHDMAVKGAPAAAAPAIAYIDASSRLGVMDSSSTNQTIVYTPSSGNWIDRPHWSPSNSVLWAEYPSSGNTSSIRAADISVSGGVPGASNIRTILSESDDTARIRFPTWSSTTSTDKIAFAFYRGSSGGVRRPSYVCTISSDGSGLDTLYTTTAGVVAGITWNADDSKLAIYLSEVGQILILNAATGAVEETIAISDNGNYGGLHSLEWSRSSSINKLMFVLDGRVQYVTPSTGSSPSTQNVGYGNAPITIAQRASWSPNNSGVMFIKATWTNSCGCDKHSLVKCTAQSSSVKDIDKTFEATDLHWHR
ncbi:MAG TPA: hypothetical protein VFH43_04495 [Candidatus Kapabacteria bacterium]|nr:hypothetical protein [Candidatus Kapabacteria bacterium]